MSALDCRTGRRRDLLRRRGINGIDAVEVADDGVTLTVYFLGGVPDGLTPAHVRIEGGGRVTGLLVVGIGPTPAADSDDHDRITVVVDRTGDACPYRLCLVETDERGRPTDAPHPGFDDRYSCATFTFTQNCRSDADCADARACPPSPAPASAPRDYLARDYRTFRRLLLDRMALVAPGWRERHVPDLGVTLVELLSYVADHLSYYQDAVATEAYLETARNRISVRRHGRLVDYVLGEGTNARAFVVVGVSARLRVPAGDVAFVTGHPGAPPVGRALVLGELPAHAPIETFHPLLGPGIDEITWWPGQDEIRIHTWGDEECCLPVGATSATLVDDAERPLELNCGDFLVLEEVRGPRTGRPGDADPRHRHVVRLTRVEEPQDDAVTGRRVLEVGWDVADALPFPLCLSALGPAPDCHLVTDVSVARGNVVLVDHGARIVERLPPVPVGVVTEGCAGPCQPVVVERRAGRFRPRLARQDLTHAEPLAPAVGAGPGAQHGPSAASIMTRDPRSAVPALVLDDEDGTEWTAVPDLLGSGPDSRVVVAELDDDRVAWLRFGDDRLGEEPEPGAVLTAHYRVGNGSVGNVGADAIRFLVRRDRDDTGVRVRNPMPAAGGVDPEPVAEAKLAIPVAFRGRRERAVTADDYAELAARVGGAGVQAAAAELVWTGSGYAAEVALDPRVGPRHAAVCAPAEQGSDRMVGDALERYRRMGHDLRVVPAEVVPIHLAVAVCALPHTVAAHVRAAIADLLSAGVRRDGSPGTFHPDRWTFGQDVDASPIVAAVAGVPGVAAAQVTALGRAGVPGSDAAPGGVLPIGRWEIALLDPGADRALGGQLEIVVTGGR